MFNELGERYICKPDESSLRVTAVVQLDGKFGRFKRMGT